MKNPYKMMQDRLITEAEDGVMEDDDLIMEILSDGETEQCREEDIDDDVEEIEDDEDEEVN